MSVAILLPRDDQGHIEYDGSFPYFITNETQFERWQMAMNVACKLSGAPRDSGEALGFAEILYHSQIPTGDATAPLEEAADDAEFDRLHPRGRKGQWVRNGRRLVLRTPEPKGTASPGTTLEQIDALGLNDWPEPSEAALSLLKGFDNSAAAYRAGEASPGTKGAHPPYLKARRLRHDKIVGKALAGAIGGLLGDDHEITVKLSKGGRLTSTQKKVVRDAANEARNGDAPDALFMAGGPASGKTTTLEQNPQLAPAHSVHIDPDAIKEDLPEYQQLRAGGDHYAASAVHLESGDIAARLAHEVTDLRLNAVIDGTGNDEPGMFIQQLERKRDAKYDVSVLYATTDTDEAVRRAVDRAVETGRFVPVPRVREQHAKVSRNFEDVVQLDWLAGLDIFDDDGHIGAMDDDGTFHELEPARLDSFRAKAREEWRRRREDA